MKAGSRLPLVVSVFAFQLWSASSYAAESNATAPTNDLPGKIQKETDYRLKWNVETLVGDYDKHGRHNPKWDASAKAALAVFAQMRTLSTSPLAKELLPKMEPAIRLALTNGCDDPLILYLSARFVTPSEKHSWKEHGEQYRLAAEGLIHGEYAPIRKFYGALRAAEALHPGGSATPQEVHH
jgi:hypothetical protein